MKKLTLAALICAVFTLGIPASNAATDLEKRMAVCASMQGSLDRLQCYDDASKANGLISESKQTSDGNTLSPSEMRAIRSQYAGCWNPPVDARNEHMVVSIVAEYNSDGSVRRAQIGDSSKMGDPLYRAAAESALRAVLNPRCNPLKAPGDKYDLWKTVSLVFDPNDLAP